MQTVNHKIYGVGEVINREPRKIGAYITVRFENEKEIRLAIPESFEIGVVSAEGDLKDDVEAAVATKKAYEAYERKRLEERRAAIAAAASAPSHRHGRRPKTSATVKGVVQTDYEAYLISAGYETETPSGHDSTVYAYSKAIANHVLKNEHMTWNGLQGNIDNIVKRYDVGGAMERIGAKSNNTVINALKRFAEFVHP